MRTDDQELSVLFQKRVQQVFKIGVQLDGSRSFRFKTRTGISLRS